MIKSMTGFGKGEHADDRYRVTVEIKSVNHRYSDISVKIPRRYSFAEEAIKGQIKNTVVRRKLDVSVIMESLQDGDLNVSLNTAVAEKYIENLNILKAEYGLAGDVSLELISSMPDVLKAIPDVSDEKEVNAVIEKAVAKAIENLDVMRLAEGEKLADDLHLRGSLLKKHVAEIEARLPETVNEYKEKLYERINELLDNKVEIPEDRILLEAAIFADKTGITEELVRLNSHTAQMYEILNSKEAKGKKLDFLVQEMNREANTIGSKTNDIDITSHVIEIKSEVEKIREQIQNIE